MDAATLGGLVGIGGGIVGLAGGVVGTYASIKNTRGPRERQFVVRAAIVVWALVTLFLVGLFLLPSPYRWFMWIPYGLALPIAIVSLNRKQQAIRSLEEQSQAN